MFIGGNWNILLAGGVFTLNIFNIRSTIYPYIGFLLDLSDGVERVPIHSGYWVDLLRTGVFTLHLYGIRSNESIAFRFR